MKKLGKNKTEVLAMTLSLYGSPSRAQSTNLRLINQLRELSTLEACIMKTTILFSLR